MKKKIFALIALVAIFATALSALAACGAKHEFATEWSKDETNHWHACTVNGHEDVADEEAHTFDSGKVTTEPTETVDGVKTYACTKCGFVKTEKIDKVAHKHTFDTTKWESNSTEHWHKATCEHADQRADEANHTFGDWKQTKAPTATETGEQQRVCNVCNYIEVQQIDALGAKENSLTLAKNVTLGKTYDRQAIVLTKEMFAYNGNGAVSFLYRASDKTEADYTETAPVKAGNYTVRVIVAGTGEWKSVSEEFNFAIAQLQITSVGKSFTVKYDGASTKFDITPKVTEFKSGDDVKVVVIMNGFTVGSKVAAVEFSGADKANYILDENNVAVTIGKALINIGHEEFVSGCKGGNWQLVWKLDGSHGVVTRGGSLEDVSLQLLKDHEWTNKQSYPLYADTVLATEKYERARLIGTDASNYEFECTDDGNLDATLYIRINATSVNGTLDADNDYDWGDFTVDDITFADREFTVMGAQGELTDVLIEEENNYKQLKFEVFIAGTTVKIAEGSRILWQDSLVEWVFTGCEFVVYEGGPADMTFDLLRGVAGYTDENGYWICEQKEVGFTLKVTETTEVVTANQELFANGLVQAGYVVVKYTFDEDDASFMRIELTEGATGTVESHVYGFVGGKFTEIQLDGMDYAVEKGKTYYIVVLVNKAGTGNVEITTYN